MERAGPVVQGLRHRPYTAGITRSNRVGPISLCFFPGNYDMNTTIIPAITMGINMVAILFPNSTVPRK